MVKRICLFVGLAAMVCAPAQAGFISSATKANGNASCGAGGCPDLDIVALGPAPVLPRNDRTHNLIEIPDELMEDNATQPNEIAEIVQMSNSDKSSAGYTMDVTLSRLSVLYVGVDNRMFGNGGGMNVQTSEYSWMSDTAFTGLPSAFINTETIIGIDENNNGSANQYFTLFAAIAPTGTYTLGDHNGGDGSNNMYIVIADDHLLAVPEPSCLALIGLGVLGLVASRRRK